MPERVHQTGHIRMLLALKALPGPRPTGLWALQSAGPWGCVGVDGRLSAGDREDVGSASIGCSRGRCYRDTLAGEAMWWRMKPISHFISQSRAN